MEVSQRFNIETKLDRLDIEQMPALLAVGGNEVEVIPRDTESARETRRPETD